MKLKSQDNRTIYEPTEFQYIVPNGVFYLQNPLENKNALPHYANEDFQPDQIVWTVYFEWQGTNPWIKKEYRSFLYANKLAGLINSIDSDMF
jgi:hypothetical protein